MFTACIDSKISYVRIEKKNLILVKSLLFVPKTNLLHPCLKIFLQSICTPVVLRIRTVVQTAVGEYSCHISYEQSPRHVVSRLKTVGHSFKICKMIVI